MKTLEQLIEEIASSSGWVNHKGEQSPDQWVYERCKEALNNLLTHLSTVAVEFDEQALKNTAENYARSVADPEKYFKKEAKDFSNGARWQFDQCKQMLAARDEKIKELNNLNGIVCECMTSCDCYAKQLAEKDAEIERLLGWKKEMIAVTSPAFNWEHPELKLGANKINKLISFAKERDELKKEIERLKNNWSSKEIADAKIKAAQLRNDLFSKEAELETTIAEQRALLSEVLGVLSSENDPSYLIDKLISAASSEKGEK